MSERSGSDIASTVGDWLVRLAPLVWVLVAAVALVAVTLPVLEPTLALVGGAVALAALWTLAGIALARITD